MSFHIDCVTYVNVKVCVNGFTLISLIKYAFSNHCPFSQQYTYLAPVFRTGLFKIGCFESLYLLSIFPINSLIKSIIMLYLHSRSIVYSSTHTMIPDHVHDQCRVKATPYLKCCGHGTLVVDVIWCYRYRCVCKVIDALFTRCVGSIV
jgi:hypothetical protein